VRHHDIVAIAARNKALGSQKTAPTVSISVSLNHPDRIKIGAIEIFHPLRQGRGIGLNQQMVMIAHLTIGMAIPVITLDRILQQCQKLLPAFICPINRFPSISPVTIKSCANTAGMACFINWLSQNYLYFRLAEPQ
jgi:hypothetical protein